MKFPKEAISVRHICGGVAEHGMCPIGLGLNCQTYQEHQFRFV